MARPVYIICAESMSLDKSSNLLSLFTILEGYTITPPPALPVKRDDDTIIVPSSRLDFVGVATWARDDSDNHKMVFDFELALRLPWEDDWRIVQDGQTRFTKPFQRFMAKMFVGFSKFPEKSGDICFASRIRREGTSEWQTQEYRVPLTIETDSEGTE